tara:strand:- start:9580 stop:9756 length:177 start_codon:yes stop_codon:yes gene_type:complete
MKLFKKFIKSYLVFGLGVIVGSVIASVVSWSVMTVAYGNPDLERTMQIKECLKERFNE